MRVLVSLSLLALWSFAPVQLKAAEVAAGAESPLEKGRYLVQAANCISCHTARNGAPFSGGKAFETPYGFLGSIYSTNITPDPNTGIGSWPEADFIAAMRSGVKPDGTHLFPAFPYTSFTKLTTPDLKAIYAYLRTLPAVHAPPRDDSFWFTQRWAMALWNEVFFESGEFKPDATQSDVWNRGYYLVEALGHCGACHTPRNLLLAESTGTRLTGGIAIGQVEGDKSRTWSAPNLTSAESGLAKWSLEDLRKYLKTGHSRRAGIMGPMNEVIANSLQYLTDADATAMATYLKSLPANGESAQQTLSEEERAAAQTLYDKHCEECHLSTGRGGLRKAPPIAGSAIVQAQNAASLVNIILYGATPASEVPNSFDTWDDMPSFKDKMTDTEVAQLANFLRATWSNRGERVSADFVAAQR
jgi:mono/diheme cytochrome c family protein